MLIYYTYVYVYMCVCVSVARAHTRANVIVQTISYIETYTFQL